VVGQPIRVAVVDDHAVFAQSVSAALATFGDVDVVGVGHSGVDALALVERARPDAVLLDYRLGNESGADVIRALCAADPAVKVVVLTASVDERTLADAMDAGCAAYLTKESSLDDVVAALRSTVAGGAVFPPELLRGVLRRRSESRAATELTARERQVLRLLAEGRSNKAIAAELALSLHTVRNHVQRVLGKLGVHSRLEAVAAAGRAGLFDER
jgi:DNA-binding NarL/FixJ family response regulator